MGSDLSAASPGFSWDAPVGRAARLLTRFCRGGLVIELGCGNGEAAEPLDAEGYSYVGADTDKTALDHLRERGFEAHQLDLSQTDTLADRLVTIADGRNVGAVLLIGGLGRVPDTDAFLASLRDALVEMGHPVLVLSVPNVSHLDIGARLVAGRWELPPSDRTDPSGLPEPGPVRFFTEASLTTDLARHGWHLLASDDVESTRLDQPPPTDHPALVSGAPLHEFLRSIRSRADATADVTFFVRAYALAGSPRTMPPLTAEPPLLSVLTRTQGTRMDCLDDTLTCLAAQTIDDLEVIVLVHSPDESHLEQVRAMIDRYAPAFRDRVRAVQVIGGGRARPLNHGLTLATGRYVAVLDDDDVVTANWAEAFAEAAALTPGRVLRSVSLSRWIRQTMPEELRAPHVAVSRPFAEFPAEFDPVSHLRENASPLCSIAVPRALCEDLSLRFDESLPVLEGWDFLLRSSLLAGVHDVPAVTSIFNRWQDGNPSRDRIDDDLWILSRRMLLSNLDESPLLLPQGSMSALSSLVENAEPGPRRGEGELLWQLEEAKGRARQAQDDARRRIEEAVSRARHEARTALEEADRLREERDEVLASEVWRLTGPIRWLIARVRAFRAR